MLPMSPNPTWEDVAVRLFLTVLASAIIGLNREAGGHNAGLRTTILVGLAASVAMIQANILLAAGGKTAASFVSMDVMRLPLGILTGVGFIGGGAILKRGNLVAGVTTAATLWAVTVIGLCFGGGQLDLGIAATVLIICTLWVLKWLRIRIPREQHARLVIATGLDASTLPDVDGLVRSAGCQARFVRQDRREGAPSKTIEFEVQWKEPETGGPPCDLLKILERAYDVQSFEIVNEGTH